MKEESRRSILVPVSIESVVQSRLFKTVLTVMLAVLFFAAFSTASATTIYVPEGGNQTIQQAVNNATAGDTIIVRDGTYNENVDVNVAHLTIQSDNGSDVTTVQAADPNDHVFNVSENYVNISGFTVTGANVGYPHCSAGIHLNSVNYCNISDNNASNNYDGIYLYRSNYNIIANTTASGNSDSGIYVHWSNDNNITHSNIFENYDTGIHIHFSNSSNITHSNIFRNYQEGISLTYSSDSIISNNNFSRNHDGGIYLFDSSNANLTGNIMNNDGIVIKGFSLEDYNTHEIGASNIVNGKPVYYCKNQTGGTVPTGKGQIILVNTTNKFINGISISNTSIGIQSYYSSNISITNCTVSENSGNGILLERTGNVTVLDNIADSNQEGGIYVGIWYNGTCIVSNNTARQNNGTGIGVYQSQGQGECLVTDNRIVGNGVGLRYLSAKGGFSESEYGHDVISGNTILFNSDFGLVTTFSHSYYVTSIVENNISHNIGGGIMMADRSGGGSIVADNIVCHNDGPGINGSWTNGGFNSTPYRIGLLIENNTFEYNNGTGIALLTLRNGGAVPVRNNSICYNNGSGVVMLDVADGGPNSIEDNNISFNNGMGIELVSLSNGGLSPIARNIIRNNEGRLNYWNGDLLEECDYESCRVGGICMMVDSSAGYPITDNLIHSNNGTGIYILSSTSGSGLIERNDIRSNIGDGIWIYYSWAGNRQIVDNSIEDNLGVGVTLGSGIVIGYDVYSNDILNNSNGIFLNASANNNVMMNQISENSQYGIYLYNTSVYNNITNNTVLGNGWYDFYSDENSHNNTVEDLSIASHPTTISFTYDNGIAIKGVDTAPSDPAGKANIGKYVNATNVTADSWLLMNVSYNDSDIAGLDESSLRMLRHDGAAWSDVAGSGVNEAANYVYANITAFSIFAPMADSSGGEGLPCTCGEICVNETGWWHDGGAFNLNDTPIQAAVDNATAGDTICVRDGTYNENVNVYKSITLKAGSSPVIDGMGGYGINVTANDTVIQDMTVTNCTTGIYLHNDSFTIQNVTLWNDTIHDCEFGVRFDDVTASELTESDIYDINSDDGAAYAVYVAESEYNNISDIEIGDVHGYSNAYGIYLAHSNHTDISISSQVGNITSDGSYSYAGGIYLGGADNNNITAEGFGDIAGNYSAEGIGLGYANNNTISTHGFGDITGNSSVEGISLGIANNNIITTMDFGDIKGDSADGILLGYANNNTITTMDFGNITADDGDASGILLGGADDNTITTTDFGNITADDGDARGISLGIANNNTIATMDFGNITSAYGDAYGMWLGRADNSTITTHGFGDIDGVGSYYDPFEGIDVPASAYGMWLGAAPDNTITTHGFGDITANSSAYGMWLGNVANANISTHSFGDIAANASACGINATVVINGILATRGFGNITSGDKDASGISLIAVDNSTITTNGLFGAITANTSAYGLSLNSSDGNTINTMEFRDITSISGEPAYGVYVEASRNNTFDEGSIPTMNTPAWWGFYSAEDSHNNTVINYTVSSYPTTVSFTYDNGIKLKGVETAPPDPAGKANIGKYVNATDVTTESWLFLNVSYSDTDISGVEESTLRLWKNNGTWNEVEGSSVNEAGNYVYANITEFSIFAPLGSTSAAGTPNITSYAPETPVNDTVCTWRTFNVTVNQTVNVTWYLNDTPLHTNESVTEAYCTLHAGVVGEHNVSAVAENAKGTDMQVWVWNVARLCGDVADYPNGDGKVNMGDVTRLLNNVSHPGNTVYVCNAWAGDCRCNGIRNMGDVTLLLNNVSYNDTRYVLDCC